jgi:2-(1,2-epoxy-1,2-dihydrophenyl)acetyl-CoA isomerase
VFDRLTISIDDGIASIALAHPEKLNVLSRALLAELIEALDLAKAAQAYVVVLTAEGRAFSSGGDLSDRSTRAGELGTILAEAYHPALRALMAMPMPVICGVNGKAVGGGCGLALACDVVIAADEASFDFAFARIGLVPDCGLAWLLPRIVGRNRARSILLGGRIVGAAEALAIGMVEQVVPQDALATALSTLARSFLARPVFATRLSKELVGQSETMSLEEALRAETVAQDQAGRSPEFKALLAAIDERRRP